MFAPILSFVTGAVGKYLLIGALSIGFLAWIRNDAAAPYRAEATALRAAAAQTERLLRADAARAEIDRAEKERLEATLESVIHEHKKSACVFSAGELASLQQLASGRGGSLSQVPSDRR